MEKVLHGPSNPRFDPATVQSQVQGSTDWTNYFKDDFLNNSSKESVTLNVDFDSAIDLLNHSFIFSDMNQDAKGERGVMEDGGG